MGLPSHIFTKRKFDRCLTVACQFKKLFVEIPFIRVTLYKIINLAFCLFKSLLGLVTGNLKIKQCAEGYNKVVPSFEILVFFRQPFKGCFRIGKQFFKDFFIIPEIPNSILPCKQFIKYAGFLNALQRCVLAHCGKFLLVFGICFFEHNQALFEGFGELVFLRFFGVLVGFLCANLYVIISHIGGKGFHRVKFLLLCFPPFFRGVFSRKNFIVAGFQVLLNLVLGLVITAASARPTVVPTHFFGLQQMFF